MATKIGIKDLRVGAVHRTWPGHHVGNRRGAERRPFRLNVAPSSRIYAYEITTQKTPVHSMAPESTVSIPKQSMFNGTLDDTG